ncbi:hypothetical protein TNCV_919731 [Trichonephila clavipes]|nr:hypothetical protein TNCV_919731 [Trichonephila clavipes]
MVFSDESCIQLCPNDYRRRVWSRPGQRADPAFTIARHTGPKPGIMLWASRWPIYDIKVREMLIQSSSSQPGLVRGTVVLLGNTIKTKRKPRWRAMSNGTLSRGSTAPETHMVKRTLHNPFTDCMTGNVIPLDGNLS